MSAHIISLHFMRINRTFGEIHVISPDSQSRRTVIHLGHKLANQNALPDFP